MYAVITGPGQRGHVVLKKSRNPGVCKILKEHLHSSTPEKDRKRC